MTASPDVLVSGSERPPRSRRTLVGLVLLALLATGVVVADDAVRRSEAAALVRRAAAAQDAVRYADGRVAATTHYTLPLLVSAAQPTQVRAGLARLVEREAAAQVAPVQRERAAVAEVRVLPWHGAQRRAQRALLAYLDARVQHLRAAAADVRVLFRSDPALAERLDQARAALLAASDDANRVRQALAP